MQKVQTERYIQHRQKEIQIYRTVMSRDDNPKNGSPGGDRVLIDRQIERKIYRPTILKCSEITTQKGKHIRREQIDIQIGKIIYIKRKIDRPTVLKCPDMTTQTGKPMRGVLEQCSICLITVTSCRFNNKLKLNNKISVHERLMLFCVQTLKLWLRNIFLNKNSKRWPRFAKFRKSGHT